jgi:hypothetical protein
MELLHIPLTSAVLISAWGNRTKRIRKQALIPFRLGNDVFEQVCIIAPAMLAPFILGADFLYESEVELSFKDKCMYTKNGGAVKRHEFVNQVADGRRSTREKADVEYVAQTC